MKFESIQRLRNSFVIPMIVLFCVLVDAPAQGECPPAKFTPILRPNPSQTLQPLVGEIKFIGTPGYAKPCSVSVEITSLRPMDAPQHFRLDVLGAYGFQITPDSNVWQPPIDSGSTHSIIFVFEPRLVGTFQFAFLHKNRNGWVQLAPLLLAIDEDGKTLCAGSAANSRLTQVTPHPKRDSSPIAIEFPLKGTKFDISIDPHFTGKFVMSNEPHMKETTYVDFTLQSHTDLYSKVQFILDYSTNLKVSDLPESWGDSSRATSRLPEYHGRFWFAPVSSGIRALNLRVVGKNQGKQFDRSTTEFPIYFVSDENGKLLFLGSYEPWSRYKSKDDLMLGSLAALVDISDRDYRLKQVLSKPDYQGDESDSAGNSKPSGNKEK